MRGRREGPNRGVDVTSQPAGDLERRLELLGGYLEFRLELPGWRSETRASIDTKGGGGR